MPIAAIEHIELDDKGVARIAGSRIKVNHLVMEREAHGLTIEQLHEWHPHLPLAAIYAAFAYYCDHKNQIDAEIEEYDRLFEEGRRKQQNDPFIQKLRKAMKK
jgi:uncharacterized protein (DUF433 family)